jgi:energy-coupling factor transporter transmembrane protein EcfT
MDERAGFLAKVAAGLTLPDPMSAEVLQELSDHLDDVASELEASGAALLDAEREAIERLGPPAKLAHDLSRAHRPRSRLLLAAGAGAVEAVRVGLFGLLLGWLFVLLAFVLGGAASRAASSMLGLNPEADWAGGWNTVLTAVTFNVAACLGGAAAVRAVARVGWSTPREVRRGVLLGGGALLAWVVLVVVPQQLNWASVIGLCAVPVAFALGTRFDALRPMRAYSAMLLLLIPGILAFGAISLARSATGPGPTTYFSWNEQTHAEEMGIPLWWTGTSAAPPTFTEGGWGGSLGTLTVDVNAASEASAAQFSGLRLEAWAAEPPKGDWRLRPGQAGPFATAPAVRAGTEITGTLRFATRPDVAWAQVTLTGVAPDGQRYILWSSGPQDATFQGTVWAWLTAL